MKSNTNNEESYGYGNYSYHVSDNQTLRNFLLMLREKFWYFLTAILIAVTGSIIYCYKATPVYESMAILQVLRDDTSVLGIKSIESFDIRSAKDLNTQIKILESMRMINSVAEALSEEDIKTLMEPYETQNELLGPVIATGVLTQHRKIIPFRTTLMVGIEYQHPNAQLAAKIANLFAEKYIEYKIRLDIENSMKAVEDLKVRVDQQRVKVEEIESKMAAYREQHRNVSLEAQADVDHKALTEINTSLTIAHTAYDQEKGKWELIQSYQKESKALEDLPFIGDNQQLKSLQLELSSKKILIHELSERYGPKHPKMISAVNGAHQVQIEINKTIENIAKQVQGNYLHKKAAYEDTKKRLKEKEADIIALSKLSIEYNSLARDLEVNQALYQSLVMRMNTEIAQIDLAKPNARIIDKAAAAAFPSKPRKLLIMAGGTLGGILLGISIVLITAYLDDRARTHFDIESVIGLPLLGLIPKMRSKDVSLKAHAVANNTEPRVLEAFRSINSAVNLSPIGKDAQVLICTSTQPSEGKTFFSLNFACTFTQHDERTIIIDADLRIPRIAKLMNKEDANGVIQYCEENANLEDIITKDEITGLDFIASGGKSLNPTRILASKKFEEMINQLRKNYDKIIIDSPPLGAVCDALNMLNCADGLIYIVKFNTTNRRIIKRNAERITESGTPIIGAVINQAATRLSTYNYDDYYTSGYITKDEKETKKVA